MMHMEGKSKNRRMVRETRTMAWEDTNHVRWMVRETRTMAEPWRGNLFTYTTKLSSKI